MLHVIQFVIEKNSIRREKQDLGGSSNVTTIEIASTRSYYLLFIKIMQKENYPLFHLLFPFCSLNLFICIHDHTMCNYGLVRDGFNL